MATIGLKKLVYAPIEFDADENEVYGEPQKLAKAITASLSVETAEGSLHADDALDEYVSEFKSGKLTLDVNDIGNQVAAELLGQQIDKNGVLLSNGDDKPGYVAIGFMAKKSNGKYRYYWLYKVKFSVPGEELATKGDNITFNTPKIEGTIFRRNSDGNWKAQLDETDDTNPVITAGWFEQVYEPDTAATLQLTPQVVVDGSDVVLSVTAMGRMYQWYEVNDGTQTAIMGANDDTAEITGLSAGDHTFICAIDGDYTLPITVTINGNNGGLGN